MKRIAGLSILLSLFININIGEAGAANIVTLSDIQKAALQTMELDTQSLIDWKVGDSQEYKVDAGMGLGGKMVKKATKEEGNAIWVSQELDMMIMKDNSELLIDRDSGKVLKFLHNGKEEQVPNEKIDVISTKQETIQVPAGKFKVLHVTAKTSSGNQLEIWTNPREISLDGAAKLYVDQGMMKITMELTKFVKN